MCLALTHDLSGAAFLILFIYWPKNMDRNWMESDDPWLHVDVDSVSIPLLKYQFQILPVSSGYLWFISIDSVVTMVIYGYLWFISPVSHRILPSRTSISCGFPLRYVGWRVTDRSAAWVRPRNCRATRLGCDRRRSSPRCSPGGRVMTWK